MDKYKFCYEANCPKFKEAEKKVLDNSESAFDMAMDMWLFVDKCCKTCERIKEATKEEQNHG